jgi:hypothetical protein
MSQKSSLPKPTRSVSSADGGQVTATFKVSVASVVKWSQRFRATDGANRSSFFYLAPHHGAKEGHSERECDYRESQNIEHGHLP